MHVVASVKGIRADSAHRIRLIVIRNLRRDSNVFKLIITSRNHNTVIIIYFILNSVDFKIRTFIRLCLPRHFGQHSCCHNKAKNPSGQFLPELSHSRFLRIRRALQTVLRSLFYPAKLYCCAFTTHSIHYTTKPEKLVACSYQSAGTKRADRPFGTVRSVILHHLFL